MSKVVVVAKFETTSSACQEFSVLLQQVAKQLISVDGCINVYGHTSVDSSNQFMMYEEWESQAAHQAHIAFAIASGAWEKIAALLVKDPEINYYTSFSGA